MLRLAQRDTTATRKFGIHIFVEVGTPLVTRYRNMGLLWPSGVTLAQAFKTTYRCNYVQIWNNIFTIGKY